MESDTLPGQVLVGKYRVDRVLGRGGMGFVVLAHHLQLDDRVAIKFMLPEALGDGIAVSRFAREARAAVRIKSEHVARVSDVGTLENGAPYMVMEYLEGEDLSAWLKRRGPLPIDQAVEFLLQACEAIAEAHQLGIVHRDLKPSNLFVIRRPDGALSVKVLDFGISKVAALSGTVTDFAMTSTGTILGSPLYMSPEQMRSAKDSDPRSDIWALGVILYELVSGATPFEAATLTELVLKIATEPPVPLRHRRPDAPVRLDAVLARCLEKKTDKRFQTVAELSNALADFAPQRSRLSLERITGISRDPASMVFSAGQLPPTDAGQQAGTHSSWGQTTPSGKASGKRAVLMTLAALALVALGGGGYALHARLKPALPAAPSATTVADVAAAVAPSAPAAALPQPAPIASVEARAPSVTLTAASSSATLVSPATAPTTAIALKPARPAGPTLAALPASTPQARQPKPKPAPNHSSVFDDR